MKTGYYGIGNNLNPVDIMDEDAVHVYVSGTNPITSEHTNSHHHDGIHDNDYEDDRINALLIYDPSIVRLEDSSHHYSSPGNSRPSTPRGSRPSSPRHDSNNNINSRPPSPRPFLASLFKSQS